jgi:hypothetical protein
MGTNSKFPGQASDFTGIKVVTNEYFIISGQMHQLKWKQKVKTD